MVAHQTVVTLSSGFVFESCICPANVWLSSSVGLPPGNGAACNLSSWWGGGEELRQQHIYTYTYVYFHCVKANILSGRYELGLVRGELELSLLERMLAHEPADRPPTAAILKHPVFWNKASLRCTEAVLLWIWNYWYPDPAFWKVTRPVLISPTLFFQFEKFILKKSALA